MKVKNQNLPETDEEEIKSSKVIPVLFPESESSRTDEDPSNDNKNGNRDRKVENF